MPKRPTEKQMEFPLFSLTYDPLATNAVVIELEMDWGLTGEAHIKFTSLQSLEDLNRVLQFVQNALADRIVHERWVQKRQVKRKPDKDSESL